ncbi:MAG: hypothetical protein KDE00_05240 [Rhodobacteraceae bacterium]|nr:hypothetical protein [Paracoccaceae bacterium]
METQKQMGAGQGEETQQHQQGGVTPAARRGEAERQQREASAAKTTQFNDWASI